MPANQKLDLKPGKYGRRQDTIANELFVRFEGMIPTNLGQQMWQKMKAQRRTMAAEQ